MTYFVYTHNLRAELKTIPFYVGKGVLSRANSLVQRNPFYGNFVAKYGMSNVEVKLWGEFQDEKEAYLAEKELIAFLKDEGIRLTNLTAGGDGFASPHPTVRQKLSSILKGNTRALGHRKSEETRRALGDRQKGERGFWFGKIGPNAGITQSEESNKKRSDTLKGRPSPMKGRTLSPQHLLAISKNSMGNTHNLGRRAINNGEITKSLPLDEATTLVNSGNWVWGRKKP
jgi:hypothetical protein